MTNQCEENTILILSLCHGTIFFCLMISGLTKPNRITFGTHLPLPGCNSSYLSEKDETELNELYFHHNEIRHKTCEIIYMVTSLNTT